MRDSNPGLNTDPGLISPTGLINPTYVIYNIHYFLKQFSSSQIFPKNKIKFFSRQTKEFLNKINSSLDSHVQNRTEREWNGLLSSIFWFHCFYLSFVQLILISVYVVDRRRSSMQWLYFSLFLLILVLWNCFMNIFVYFVDNMVISYHHKNFPRQISLPPNQPPKR